MNEKITFKITEFMNSVGDYIKMEYKPKYYKEYTKEQNLSHLFDFVGSYYMGGSNVPDAARYVVEFFKMENV